MIPQEKGKGREAQVLKLALSQNPLAKCLEQQNIEKKFKARVVCVGGI